MFGPSRFKYKIRISFASLNIPLCSAKCDVCIIMVDKSRSLLPRPSSLLPKLPTSFFPTKHQKVALRRAKARRVLLLLLFSPGPKIISLSFIQSFIPASHLHHLEAHPLPASNDTMSDDGRDTDAMSDDGTDTMSETLESSLLAGIFPANPGSPGGLDVVCHNGRYYICEFPSDGSHEELGNFVVQRIPEEPNQYRGMATRSFGDSPLG